MKKFVDWVVPKDAQQLVVNVLADSREGYLESLVNATMFDAGNPQWTPLTWFTSIFTHTITRIRRPYLLGWDIYRAERRYVEGVTGKTAKLIDAGYEKPDYWNRGGHMFGLVPRRLINATPTNDSLIWWTTRGPAIVLLIAGIATWWIPGAPLIIGAAAAILGLTTGPLWHYDAHRFFYGDGWKSLGKSQIYHPLKEWKWLPPAEVAPAKQPLPEPAETGLKNYQLFRSALVPRVRNQVQKYDDQFAAVFAGGLPEKQAFLNLTDSEKAQIDKTLNDLGGVVGLIHHPDETDEMRLERYSLVNFDLAKKIIQENSDIFNSSEAQKDPRAWLIANPNEWLWLNISGYTPIQDKRFGLLSGFPVEAVKRHPQYQTGQVKIANALKSDSAKSPELLALLGRASYNFLVKDISTPRTTKLSAEDKTTLHSILETSKDIIGLEAEEIEALVDYFAIVKNAGKVQLVFYGFTESDQQWQENRKKFIDQILSRLLEVRTGRPQVATIAPQDSPEVPIVKESIFARTGGLWNILNAPLRRTLLTLGVLGIASFFIAPWLASLPLIGLVFFS